MITLKNVKLPHLFIVAAFLIFSGCANQTAQESPNILWITSEDNSPFIGAYGDSLANTPNIDGLADRGLLFENAFATTPVCAPSRYTLITGTYAPAMGTEQMRSTYPVPDFVKFFPRYLREAGYYTTNNVKKDYNTVDQPEAWDESSQTAHYSNREDGQPFFHVRNFTITHESSLHQPIDSLVHDPGEMNIPPYHPDTDTVRRDWARYYDLMTQLDGLVGVVLEELQESGEAENTIVFYYSDHGGVLPRSKRYMFEAGLRVPLIVYIPPKFEHMIPDEHESDRLVSFVDFAPTVLSLAGIEPPEWMHGRAFLGEYSDTPREYVHVYRGRMDERYDLMRSVRDKEYLYVHNYMPNRIYGQHLSYLWRSRTMQNWHNLYLSGELNEIQQRFFETKPAEELYDVSDDPHNINNLAGQPEYRDVLMRMREENLGWMMEYRDLGFIQESRIDSLRGDGSLYDAVREKDVPVEQIIRTAEMASLNKGSEDDIERLLLHNDSSVRYWATRRLISDQELSQRLSEELLNLADDPAPAVRIAAAEALFGMGEEEAAFSVFRESLDHPHFTVQLLALNTLEALDADEMPQSLVDKITTLHDGIDPDSFGTDYYIRRASGTLLDRR